jgi:DNA adenine methylase
MNSPIAYLGGKSRLAKHIVPLIPADHVCYCEPFCGASWILFKKDPSKHEVINDLDAELVNFWRIIQIHLQPFLDYFKFAVISRTLFDLENRRDPSTLTDLQRAVRYYYLQRLGFGGRPTARTFGTGTTGPSNFNLLTLEESLLEVHWRLARVTIEHLDAIDCVRRYDRPATFFYLDPPYYHVTQDYCRPFEDADFLRLRDSLASISGRFILSLNDHPDIRSMFKQFRLRSLSTRYSVGNSRESASTRSKPHSELLIFNFPPKSHHPNPSRPVQILAPANR